VSICVCVNMCSNYAQTPAKTVQLLEGTTIDYSVRTQSASYSHRRV
jgi:hypothetical protein